MSDILSRYRGAMLGLAARDGVGATAEFQDPGITRILERHPFDADPGIPDLFLFKRKVDGTPFGGCFVEAKRPAERLSPEQIEELRFLRSLRVKAGVVRLRYERRRSLAPR